MSITPIIPSAVASTVPLPPTARRCRLAAPATDRGFADRRRRGFHLLAALRRLAIASAVLVVVRLTNVLAAAMRQLADRADLARAAGDDTEHRFTSGRERGQATTEYALILLAAALVGLMVVAWATAGGGAARISRLFNGVIDAVVDKV